MDEIVATGLSRPRRNQTFEWLDLQDMLAKDTAPRCGLIVVDTRDGRVIEWLRFEHTIDELYDVAILPAVAHPEAIGFVRDNLHEVVSPECAAK